MKRFQSTTNLGLPILRLVSRVKLGLALLMVLIILMVSSCDKREIIFPESDLQELVEGGVITDVDSIADDYSKTIFTNFEITGSFVVVPKFVTETGAGTEDGTSWDNAWAGADLRANLAAITDASAQKVYVVLVAGGTYKPTTGTGRSLSFSMKNYVAIIGGFDASGSWDRTGTTVFSGDIGVENETNDNSYHVFNNTSALDHAILRGVTITKGNADANSGGGMYNSASHPRIIEVIFSDNQGSSGGGLANENSSPLLIDTEIANNQATSLGGGLYNYASSPIFINAVISNNTAPFGGGGFNANSSKPIFTGVMFISNTATLSLGGGMYNDASDPKIIDSQFKYNRATGSNGKGGAVYNEKTSAPEIDTTSVSFTGNSATISPDVYTEP